MERHGYLAEVLTSLQQQFDEHWVADRSCSTGAGCTPIAARVRWTTRLNGVLSVMANRSAPSDRRRRAWRDITRW